MRPHDLVKSRNFFGHPVYSPLAALMEASDSPLRAFLEERLKDTLGSFGSTVTEVAQLAAHVVEEKKEDLARASRIGLKRRYVLEALEDDFRDSLRKELFGKESIGQTANARLRSAALANRSEQIATQLIRVLTDAQTKNPPLFKREAVALLDVGCGDGTVMAALAAAMTEVEWLRKIRVNPVVLLDVADYRTEAVINLEWQFTKLPSDYEQFVLNLRPPNKIVEGQRFDLLLLLTVLHHSQVPSRVFRACADVANVGAVIVVIESCVGIERIDDSHLVFNATQEVNAGSDARSQFSKLGADEQLRYAAFVDWFYNRVIQKSDDVYVPCNFGTPAEWNDLFEEFAGFEVLATYEVGFDQPLVPEFHTIHVVQRSEASTPESA